MTAVLGSVIVHSAELFAIYPLLITAVADVPVILFHIIQLSAQVQSSFKNLPLGVQVAGTHHFLLADIAGNLSQSRVQAFISLALCVWELLALPFNCVCIAEVTQST